MSKGGYSAVGRTNGFSSGPRGPSSVNGSSDAAAYKPGRRRRASSSGEGGGGWWDRLCRFMYLDADEEDESRPLTPAGQVAAAGGESGVEAPSLPEAFHSVTIPSARQGEDPCRVWWRKMLAYVGPGYMVAVGYMDPGNWATDLAGGAQYGYSLLSIVLLSCVLAMFLQVRRGDAPCT